ncbi:MAG: hydrogen peroxide-dependent heme synthase, partial [Mycobacterium sp.]|nr:hydrogen peroxide-dependent heme synthase [Mycobacterium sp.]
MKSMAKLDYDTLNSMTRYMMISVFAVQPEALGEERAAVVDETATFLKQQEEGGVV